MNKLLLPLATAAILAIVAGLWFLQSSASLNSAPDISLNFIDGRKIEFNSFQGKPLLVTFWATTCSTCLQEMPHLVELYDEFNKDGFEIIAIAMPYDPPNRVVELSERKNIPYPIALDIEGRAAMAFGNISVTPTSFLIDQQGNIVQQKTGAIDIEQLRLKVKTLLQTNPTTVS